VKAETGGHKQGCVQITGRGEMESRHRGTCQGSRGNTRWGVGDRTLHRSVLFVDPGNCDLT